MTTEAGPQSPPKLALWIALAIAIAVLLLDTYTPQEMPAQYLHVLSVFVAVWAHQNRAIWWMASLCTGLTLLGVYLSPPTFDFHILLFNRTTAIALIWLTAIFAQRYRRTHDQLIRLNRNLESQVEDRARELARAFAEREQLNRDLHDDVLQSLYAVGLNLEAEQAAQPAGRIPQALQQLTLTMKQIRSYIAGAQPSQIDAPPLDAALPDLVQRMTLAQGPVFRFTMDPGIAEGLSRRQTDALLLIVREALSNCARHARAREGLVTAHRQNGALQINIQDDGIGFDTTVSRPDGHGLTNMGVRARSIGATFEVASQPGHGTRITLALPLPKRSAGS